MEENEKKLKIECNIEHAIVIGDLMTYNIQVINEAIIPLEEVTLYEVLDVSLSFCKGSVEVNGERQCEDSPFSGICLGELLPGQSKNIKFQAMVRGGQTDELIVQMKAHFVYTEKDKKQIGESSSNMGRSKIYKVALMMQKKALIQDTLGVEEVTYQINLKNEGQLRVNSIIFQDIIPKEFELVDGGMSIGDHVVHGVQLAQGIYLGKLDVGESIDIFYKVRVGDAEVDENSAGVAVTKYRYELPDGRLGSLRKQTLTVDISNRIQRLMMTQVNLTTMIESEEVAFVIENINEVEVDVEIKHYKIEETAEGINEEGQKMTGIKMIVQGILTFCIEYVEGEGETSIKRKTYQRLFTANIGCNKNWDFEKKSEILGEVKHIHYDVGDKGELVINSLIMVRLMV